MTTTDRSETVTVTCRRCFLCGEQSTVTVPLQGFTLWQSGALVQFAFPEMPAEQRELLISGNHPECWDREFDRPIDDEDEEQW